MLDHYITVAEAAAILNVAIVVVQITYPLLITLVAVGIVKRRTNAATWSVFGRLINLSYFPFLLQTDAVAGNKVDGRIRGLALSSGLTSLLLAVAAIVTPLGLHSRINTTDAHDVRFQYVKDTSAMGRATQSHLSYNSSRTCENGLLVVPCPGNDDGIVYYKNSTGFGLHTLPGREGTSITSWIPQNVTDVFTSASSYDQGTVASLFDMQYRTFVNYNNETKPNDDENHMWMDYGKPRTQGRFKYYQQFLLENKTRAIEGLIVSTQEKPGIGFRNHTLPPASEYGYTWSEEILFLEPRTECTNLNLTYEYIIPPPDGLTDYALNQTLVDRGGFVDLPEFFPVLDLNDTQSNAQYLDRSYAAAVMTNAFLAKFMNLTRKSFRTGTEYTLADFQDPDSFTSLNTSDYEPNRLYFSPFGYTDVVTNATAPSLPGPLKALKSNYKKLSSGLGDIAYIAYMVNGYAGGDPINITTIGAGGGLILGTGVQVDEAGNPVPGSDASRPTPGSKWSQPLFACVSGVTASVKKVNFQLNGTAILDNLIVESVRPVNYSTNDALPMWAMERTHRNISQVAPYWGLVSQDAAQSADVSIIRRADFHLPAGAAAAPDVDYGTVSVLSTSADAIAGARVPFAAMRDIFAGGYDGPVSGAQDYTGANNYLLYLQWQQLLSNSSTTGRVVDLIWTDLMANALVGANSPLKAPSGSNLRRRDTTSSSATFAMRPASRNAPSLTYDWRYAIPALIFLCIYIGLVIWSLVMFMTRSLSINILRFMLNQTSAGRSITTERYQASNDIDVAPTAVWTRIRGGEMVRIGKDSVRDQHFGKASWQEYSPVQSKSEAQVTSEQVSH